MSTVGVELVGQLAQPLKSKIPEYLLSSDLGMSNCDNSIDDGLESRLKEGKEVAQHSAWNFCGFVWFDKETDSFLEEVWVYREPKEIFAATTLPELMELVNKNYGYE